MNDPKPLAIGGFDADEATGACDKHGYYVTYVRKGRDPSCPICLQATLAAANAENAKQTVEDQAAVRARALGIPSRYAHASLDSVAELARKALEAWAKSAESRARSFVLIGPVGVGKTYAACALALRCKEANVPTRYASQASILRAIRSTWSNRSERSEESVWRELTAPYVLIVDDVGAARGNENDALRISELIDERYNEQKPTIIVTNLKPEQLKLELGDRAYDRICEGGKLVVMTGESRRRAA